MYTHWKTCTNCVIAKPRDVSFISSVKKDRPPFHPPCVIINQVTMAKGIVVLEVEMVHLAEQMDSIITKYTMCYCCMYVAPVVGMSAYRRSNRR